MVQRHCGKPSGGTRQLRIRHTPRRGGWNPATDHRLCREPVMPQADQILHPEVKEFFATPAPQFDTGRAGPTPARVDDHQIHTGKFARGQFESGLRDNK
jgi:hypothetical protein